MSTFNINLNNEEIRITNPRSKRIDELMRDLDPHNYAIQSKKDMAKKSRKLQLQRDRKEKQRNVNEIRKLPRVFSDFTEEIAMSYEEKFEAVTERIKFTHSQIVAANMKNKKNKKLRKQLRRQLSDTVTEAASNFFSGSDEKSGDQPNFGGGGYNFFATHDPSAIFKYTLAIAQGSLHKRHKDFLMKWNMYIANFIMSTWSFINIIKSIKGPYDRKALAYLYIQTFAKHDLFANWVTSRLMYQVMKFFTVVENEVQTESLSDGLDYITNLFTTVTDSKLTSVLKTLAMSIASLHIFPKDVAKKVFTYCETVPRAKGSDIIVQLLTSMASLARMTEAIIAGVSISDVLFEKDPVDTAIQRMMYLASMSNSLHDGIAEEGKMEINAFVKECSDLLPLLRHALSKMNPYSKNFSVITSLVQRMTPEYEAMKSRILGQARRAPIGVVVFGSPGIGKSNWLDWIATVHADVAGRAFDESDIYHRVLTSDYWEGYDSFKHRAVHYSELGSDKATLVERQGDKNISELTTILDSVPLSLDMAFTGKSKTFFTSDLVLIDTNFEDMNISAFKRNVSAYQRRFIYVEPTVLESCRKDNGCGIDPRKGSDRRLMDKYSVNIYVYEQVNNSSANKVPLLINGDIDQAYDLLYALFKRHIINQNDMRAKKENDKSVGYGSSTLITDSIGRPYHIKTPEQEIDIDKLLEEKRKEIFPRNDMSYTDKIRKMRNKPYLNRKKEERESEKHYYVDEKNDVHVENWQVLTHVEGKFLTFVDRSRNHIHDISENLRRYAYGNIRRHFWLSTLSVVIKYIMMLSTLVAFPAALLTGNFVAAIWATLVTVTLFLIPERALENAVSDDDAVTWDQVSHSVWNFYGFLKGDSIVIYSTYTASIIAAGIALWKTWDFINSFRDVFSQGDEISKMKENDEDEEKIDKLLDSQPALSRTKGMTPGVWTVKHNVKPLTHTGSASSLSNSISSNTRMACIDDDGSLLWTTIFGVFSDVALVNKHAIPMNKQFILRVSRTGDRELGVFADTIVNPCDVREIADDVVAIRLSSMMFKDVRKHFSDVSFKIAQGCVDGYSTHLNVQDVIEAKGARPATVKGAIKYKWPNHGKGKCGTPVCAQIGSRACIVGIHFAGSNSTGVGFAAPIKSSQLDFKLQDGLMEITSQADEKVSLADPHARSPFRFRNLLHVDYYGSDGKAAMMNDTTCVSRHKLSDDLIVITDSIGIFSDVMFAPPCMKRNTITGADPIATNLLKISTHKKPLNRESLKRCVDHLCERFGNITFQPLTVKEAINGSLVDDYLRRINASTGGGYGYPGKKSKYLPVVDGETRMMSDKVKVEVNLIIDKYISGQTNGTIFGAKLKDEPRDVRKVEVGKTRMFYPAPVPALVVARIVLGPFFSYMVSHRKTLRSAVGINMYTDAPEFYDDITEYVESGDHDEEAIFEGDYGGYDTSMPYEIGLAASTVIYNVCKKAGYNHDALKVLSGVLTDNLFPYVEVKGDIFRVPGLMTSGSYGTAEFNCIRNVLLMLYYFDNTPGLQIADLYQKTKFAVYGDDVLASVKKEIRPYFNCIEYSKFCTKIYGMDFTTSSKGEVNQKFVKVKDMTFLKRTFKYSPDFGKVVAVLDPNSMVRMLEWTMPSSSVTYEDQLIATMQSFLYELAQGYGRTIFEDTRSRLSTLVEREFGAHPKLPSWGDVMKVICPNATIVKEEEQCPDELSFHDVHVESRSLISGESTRFLEYNTGLSTIVNLNHNQCPQKITIMNMIEKYEKQVSELKIMISDLEREFGGVEPELLVNSKAYFSSSIFRKRVNIYRNIKSDLMSSVSSLEFLSRKYHMKLRDNILTESDELSMKDEKAPEIVHENVVDSAGCDFVYRDAGTSVNPLKRDPLTIQDFFMRPLQIAAVRIDPDLTVNYSLNIWDVYTRNAAVRAKFRNNAYARFDLEVSIVFTGSPFHAGRYLVSYQPFAQYNYALQQLSDVSRSPSLYTYLSQARGATCIDVKSNNPVIMKIPYMSPKPVARLFNDENTVISEATSYADFESLGQLYVVPLTPVSAVSTGASDIFFYIYCRAINVSMHTPTATLMDITTEADEREKGPVERYSSVAIDTVKALAAVPQLALFAKASEIGLRAVNKLASLFGWSYPTLIAHPVRVRQDPWQNGSQTIGIDTGKRVTLDPKQEMPLINAMFGSGNDDMTISEIARIETWLDKFTWEATSESMVDVIFQMKVSPLAFLDRVDHRQPTALAFAAMPFRYWRGTIIVRFDVVCSAFHRGKLMIVYEPNVRQSALITVGTELNKQYIKIIDLQETQSVEIPVSWNFPRPWASNMSLEESQVSVGSQFVPNLTDVDTCNGMIYVLPFTQLQSPDNSSVTINAFVRGENMMFNRFTRENLPENYDLPDIKTEADDLSTLYTAKMTMGEDILDMKDAVNSCFGEVPLSFRSLLKRFAFGSKQTYTSVEETYGNIRYAMKTVPDYAQDYSPTDKYVNLYTYLRTSYLAQRGALRHRTRTPQSFGAIGVTLGTDSTVYSTTGINVENYPVPEVDGTVMFMMSVNSGIEYEIPFYTNNLWVFAFNRDPYVGGSAMNTKLLREYFVDVENTLLTSAPLYDFIAAAEDFSFHHFVGAAPFTPPIA